MDPKRVAGLVFAMALITVGCATSGPADRGASDLSSIANFEFAYETTYQGHGGASGVMRTNLRLVYDPESGRVLGSWFDSEGDGGARRVIRVIPDPDGYVLRLRIFTDLDPTSGSTALEHHSPRTEDEFYGDLGIRSVNTLVEGVEIVFLGDGGWAVANATGAHLINAGGQVTRKMTSGQDGIENLVALYP